MPNEPRSVPWYRQGRQTNQLARRYWSVLQHLDRSAGQWPEIRSFTHHAAIRLVFESNYLEGAGLPHGETRKVVDEHFPTVPMVFDDPSGPLPEDLAPTVSFSNQTRPVREVIQHFRAFIQSRLDGRGMRRKLLDYVYAGLALQAPEFRRSLQVRRTDGFTAGFPQASRVLDGDLVQEEGILIPDFFSEAGLRRLHHLIGHGIMPADSQVEAGQYRIDARSVGLDVVFPAAELVPAAMERWVASSNACMVNQPDPIQVAASLSHAFVRIHPFPDFNGRISRLILNEVLAAWGLPFPVSLRSDARGRRRYLRALRRANRGDLSEYATLIAIAIVDSFREIDVNLVQAGLAPFEEMLVRVPPEGDLFAELG